MVFRRRTPKGVPPADLEATRAVPPPPAEPWPADGTRLVHEEVYQPPPPPPPPRRPLVWPWLLLLLLLVLGGLAAAYFVTRDDDEGNRAAPVTTGETVTRPPTGARVVVPSLVGLRQPQASARLRDRDLVARTRDQPSERPRGVVTAQNPGAGTRVVRDSTVTLVVSAGRPEVTVPDVVGEAAPNAVAQLKRAGLTSSVRGVFAAEPRGTVISQQPSAGTSVERGRDVLLRISKGPATVPLPDVVGLDQHDAVSQLRDAGLTARIFRVPSADPAGTVVAMSPAAGTRVAKGKSIRLNVSRGAGGTTGGGTTGGGTTGGGTTGGTTTTTPSRSPQPLRTVPRVVGFFQEPAQRRLRAEGFRPVVRYVPSTQPAGKVVAQSPAAGAKRRKGSRIQINVSNGPAARSLKTVPDVLGLDEATATSRLRNAGFRVSVVEEDTTEPDEDGIVIDEQPSGGTRAPQGSVITIVVGVYAGP